MAKKGSDLLWNDFHLTRREEYQAMIVQFASLTELFAQKDGNLSNENDSKSKRKKPQKPFISSKFQETVFKHAFDASIEDIGNTSYDASVNPEIATKVKGSNDLNAEGCKSRYLFGIKTFLIDDENSESFQKIAQFKSIAESLESQKGERTWGDIITLIRKQAKSCKNESEIVKKNKNLYMELALKLASARNKRIDSSKALIEKRLGTQTGDADFRAVYHFLMPSVQRNGQKVIYLGEIPYENIGRNIEIIGITDVKHPTNFLFKDENNNVYKYTSADSQLYMKFKHHTVNERPWIVSFKKDAYKCFKFFFEQMAEDEKRKKDFELAVQENKSFSFLIQLEKYSGFNNFYGLSCKHGHKQRIEILRKIIRSGKEKKNSKIKSLAKSLEEYFKIDREFSSYQKDEIVNMIQSMVGRNQNDEALLALTKKLCGYFGTETTYSAVEWKKLVARKKLTERLNRLENENAEIYGEVVEWARSLLWRTAYEMYIRLPISFHRANPDFFGPNLFEFDKKGRIYFIGEKKNFRMSFGPSTDDNIDMHLTQSSGKGLQSSGTQTRLGEWILRDVFQLKKWEPLTEQKLRDSHINGFRLKKDATGLIHFEFIWIDIGNPPIDFWGGKD